MVMNWNSDADAKLLVGIVNYTDFKLNKETLAKLNEWMGPDCVGQSISQRLIKLKKKFYEEHPELIGANVSGNGPKTPKSGTKRKVVDDDEEETVTPTPKKRGGRPKKADAVKTENGEGAGEDAAAPATLTPKKRGRPKKAELAKDNDVVKQEPGSEVESKADSVMQGSNVADQLLAAAEAGDSSDKEDKLPLPDSDDEA
ncbi:hypothetical protein HDK90DRAFT_202926 [Phyllosticta capitalensis]|uniref:Uncharacterized protein n=1 Tax=Phyllosticta capitalensis TaxID=121624 RepID=A0ABR1YSC7_9PEZI